MSVKSQFHNNNRNNNYNRRFTQCNTSANRPTGTIAVLDPTGGRGLLHVPVSLTMPTRGRDEWLSGKLQKDLSLCTLFQKGRCHAHSNCFQVHADLEFVAKVRAEQASMISCCVGCGDSGSKGQEGHTFLEKHVPASTKLAITFPNGESRVVDRSSLAYTEGLVQQFVVHRSHVENGRLEVPVRRVCRLHLKSFCKYGKDCKNVHLCCKLGEAFLEEPKPVVSTVAPVVVVDEPAPMPIPCFRVPSLSSLRPRDSPLTPSCAEEASQDDEKIVAAMPSFKLSEASLSKSGSRMLRNPFVFHAEIAMEDSNFDQSIYEKNDDSINSASGISDEWPTTKSSVPSTRRASLTSDECNSSSSPHRQHHTLQLNALHPCSKASLVSSPACRLNPQDIHAFVAMFS